jgi:hypothetical protein
MGRMVRTQVTGQRSRRYLSGEKLVKITAPPSGGARHERTHPIRETDRPDGPPLTCPDTLPDTL